MKLTIGMPVYNGELYLKEALTSLCNQTFVDWKLVISDNASSDDTANIIKSFAAKDSRIIYVRQQENIGPFKNFEYVLNRADTDYFMWAACDDIWDKKFIEVLIEALEDNPQCGLAFSHSLTIDAYGGVVQTFQNFSPFEGRFGVIRYILQPHILGKSSLLYGVYRTSVCKQAWTTKPITPTRGSDNTFVLAALCRNKVYIDKRVLFLKRWPRSIDIEGKPQMENYRMAWRYSLPVRDSYYYAQEALVATRGTAYYFVVWFLIIFGWPLIIFNDRARQWEKLRAAYRRLITRKI